METVTVGQMRVLDANSAWFGVPVSELMENAGRAVAAEANKLGESFVVVCGPGNNGGDGFACARYLKSRPRVFYFWQPHGAEAAENFAKARNYHPIQITDRNNHDFARALAMSDVVIDAIFGTGAKGKIREPARGIIEAINASGKKIVSIDVPSGMDPDTGRVEDVAVRPTMTVYLHAMKKGLEKSRSAGRVIVAGIGISPKAATHVGKGDFKFGYPKRKENAHKGDAGKVLVAGGSKEYTGAPYFAAMAALKAGCDLSYVAAPGEAAERIAVLGPDLIVYPLKSEHYLSKSDVTEILSKKSDILLIGNGLGDNKGSLEAAKEIMLKAARPIVIDGDGLKAAKQILLRLGRNVILTPHGGEFRMLFGMEPNEKNLRKAAAKLKCAILLKGHIDLIAQGDKLKYNESGNPYMSKGGTGDVLAGLCAGYLAQGVEPFDAACFAALVNGVAGDIAYSEESIALTASDVLARIGMAEKMLLD
jgi:NAD(P)H-hydrate epimerase